MAINKLILEHSNGNVGIGTTDPGAKIDVIGNVRTSTYYRFNGNPTNPTDSTASVYDQSGVGPTISGLNITFRTGSTPSERMRIESTGNVSIGTTDTSFGGLVVTQTGRSSELAGVQLYRDVGNYGAIQINGANGGYIDFASPGIDYQGRIIYFTSSNSMNFVTNSAIRVSIDGTGNTGFGLTNPNAKIDIVQSGASGGVANTTGSGLGLTHGVGAGFDALALALRTTGVGSGTLTGSQYVSQIIASTTNANALEMYITGNSPLVFGTNSTERMRILGGGYVGIGTTSPAALIHAYLTTPPSDTIGIIQYQNDNTGTGASTNAQLIGKSKYGTAQYMVWENYGLRFGMRSTANSGAGDIYITAGSDSVKMFIGSSGTVAIGTTNPTLHSSTTGLVVRGSARGIIELWDSAGTGKAVFQQVGATTYLGNLSGNGDLRLLVNGTGSSATELLNLTAGGNVGIGVTNSGEKLQVNDGSIYINGEGCGLIVDAGGSKRIGFMKYAGHEAYISRATGQDFGIVRVGTSDLKSVTGLVHDIYISGGGYVSINTPTPLSRFSINGALSKRDGDIDLATHTHSAYWSVVSSGYIEFTLGYSGTQGSGRVMTFTYEATDWKSWWCEIDMASTEGSAFWKLGGYNNNSNGHNIYETHDGNGMATVTYNNSGQYNVITLTFNRTHIHPGFRIKYHQSGGDGAPRMDRAKIVWS